MSCVDAAAFAGGVRNDYLNLYMEAALAPTERVIVHAGASGVGTAALQMLKHSNNPSFVTWAIRPNGAMSAGADAGSIVTRDLSCRSIQAWAKTALTLFLIRWAGNTSWIT